MTGTLAAIIGLGTILAAATLVWMLSVKLRDASIADVCWGLGFVLLAWLYVSLSPGTTARSWLVATLITLWGVRLSVHIFRRNHGQAEDPRYQAMRASHGPAFWRRNSSRSSGCRPRSSGSSPSRCLSQCAPYSLPLSLPSMALESCASRLALPSKPWATKNSSGSGPSSRTAARCSIAASGATRGIRTTWGRHCVVGPVCDSGGHAGRMAHCPEPGPHDAVADASVRGNAARGQPQSVEARLPGVHRSHAGIRPMVSARSEVSLAAYSAG